MNGITLPKWPQMIVTGKRVSLARAREIIRRTDVFFNFGCGNNKPWIEEITKRLRIPSGSNRIDDYYGWRRMWGSIDVGYVHNDWISSSFVYGPSGWCHPDGAIGFVDNVGKWPSVEDIQRDWEALIAAFPFLDLRVSIMSGESCDGSAVPAAHMTVRKGRVDIHEPIQTVDEFHKGNPPAFRSDYSRVMTDGEVFEKIIRNRSSTMECAIPREWVDVWEQKAKKIFGKADAKHKAKASR